jgi:hypothetical protein
VRHTQLDLLKLPLATRTLSNLRERVSTDDRMHRIFLTDDFVALMVVTVYPLNLNSSGWNHLVNARQNPDLRALAFTNRLFNVHVMKIFWADVAMRDLVCLTPCSSVLGRDPFNSVDERMVREFCLDL